MTKKELACLHAKISSFYVYEIVGADLILCKECEKKLRAEIFEQDKIEKEIPNE